MLKDYSMESALSGSLHFDERSLGINDVVNLTGISAFTIRYYDKCGFFPDLIRGKRGVRSFSAQDVRQLRLVDALRRSGMSIEGIRYYVRLAKHGSETRAERFSIVKAQATALEYQIAESEESLALLRAVLDDLSENEALSEKADC